MQRSCTPSSFLDQTPPCPAATTAAGAAEQKQQQQLAGTVLPPALMEKAAELLNSEEAANTPRHYTARELLQASASGNKVQQHPPSSWQKLASQLLSSSDTDEDVTSRRHDARRTDQQQVVCTAGRPGTGDTLLPCRLEQRFLLQGASPSLQQQQQQQACQQQPKELLRDVSSPAVGEPAQGPSRLLHSSFGTPALQQRLAARARDLRLSADLGQLDVQHLPQPQHHSAQQAPPFWSGRSSRSSSRSEDGSSPGSRRPQHGLVCTSQPPGGSSRNVRRHCAGTPAHSPSTATGSGPSRRPVSLTSSGGIGRHRAADFSSSGHHVLYPPQQASTTPGSSHPHDTCSRSPLLRATAALSSGSSAGGRCRPQQCLSTDFNTPAGHLCAAYVLPSTAQQAHAASATGGQAACAANEPSRCVSASAGRWPHAAQQDRCPALGEVMAPWKLSAWLMKADARRRPQRLVRRAHAVNLSSGSEDDAADSDSSSGSDGDSSANSGSMAAATAPGPHVSLRAVLAWHAVPYVCRTQQCVHDAGVHAAH